MYGVAISYDVYNVKRFDLLFQEIAKNFRRCALHLWWFLREDLSTECGAKAKGEQVGY